MTPADDPSRRCPFETDLDTVLAEQVSSIPDLASGDAFAALSWSAQP